MAEKIQWYVIIKINIVYIVATGTIKVIKIAKG